MLKWGSCRSSLRRSSDISRLSKTGYKGDLAGTFLFSARSCAFSSSALIHLYIADLAPFSITCAQVISFDARLIHFVKGMLNVLRSSAKHVRQVFLAPLLLFPPANSLSSKSLGKRPSFIRAMCPANVSRLRRINVPSVKTLGYAEHFSIGYRPFAEQVSLRLPDPAYST